jgi:hypothetical protein
MGLISPINKSDEHLIQVTKSNISSEETKNLTTQIVSPIQVSKIPQRISEATVINNSQSNISRRKPVTKIITRNESMPKTSSIPPEESQLYSSFQMTPADIIKDQLLTKHNPNSLSGIIIDDSNPKGFESKPSITADSESNTLLSREIVGNLSSRATIRKENILTGFGN